MTLRAATFLIGLAVVIYAFAVWLPWDALYRLAPSTIRRGKGGGRQVSLTFDDGPSIVTPLVLDALRAAGVHATFFLVAERAREHPAIVNRILSEGHEVAYHGRRHVHAALVPAWRARSEMVSGIEELQRLTGGRLSPYARPPHGAASRGWVRGLSDTRTRMVLWSVDGRDYRADRTAEAIAADVIERVRDGDVVDLHDAGGAPGAPERTLRALPDLIAGLRRRGLEPVPLGTLLAGGEEPVTWGIRIWEVWEGIFARVEHSVPVGVEGLMAISVREYRGPDLQLEDGRVIRSGVQAGEIHLGNYAVSRLAGGARETFRLLRVVRATMDTLALMVAEGTFPGVEVFFGTSLLGRAADLVGLHPQRVRPSPGLWVNKLYMRILLRIYHPDGAVRLTRHRDALVPVLCYVTAEELRARARRLADAGGPCGDSAERGRGKGRLGARGSMAMPGRTIGG